MNLPSSSRDPLSIDVGEPALNREDVLLRVREGLKGLKVSKRQPVDHNSLKVKLEYLGEKRCISVTRPVTLQCLEATISKLYDRAMHIYYVQGRSEVLIAIRTQDDLQRALEVVDRSNLASLRLLLSKHDGSSKNNWSLQPDSSGTYTASVVEVPYTESCSSCGAARQSLARSIAGGSSCSSGVQLDSDDWRASAHSPRAPSQWKLGKNIGSGAFGSVFVVHDVETGRDLAMKRVALIPQNREASREAQGLEYDVRELAKLQHPQILQYIGVQKTSDAILIFMEYMPGGSVKYLIEIEGRLTPTVATRYIRQVLEGLSFLHKNHIVHRDIKPANILRDLQANVKIADFGSGKKLQSLATQQGGFNGTVHYTAPEVLLGKSAYGRKADVWSVGVTLVEMLTGRVPWSDLDPMAAMFQIAYETPDIEYPANVSETLIGLTRELMTKDFNERKMAKELLLNHAVFK